MSLPSGLYLTYVLAGPYALFGFRNTSGQLARRGRDIHFARYHVDNKEERIAFVAALRYLLERVPLEVDLNTSLSRWRWWAIGCVGCIGILKDWLVDAVAATLAQNGASLTETILTRTMPHPAKRLSLEMEARAGEHSIARHDSESAKQFQALVKKPTKVVEEGAKSATGNGSGVSPAGQADRMRETSAATAFPMPQVTPKPTKPRVGQRAPERDLVGNTPSPPQKAVGCPFTEVISVTHAQAEKRVSGALSVQPVWPPERLRSLREASNSPGTRSAQPRHSIMAYVGSSEKPGSSLTRMGKMLVDDRV